MYKKYCPALWLTVFFSALTFCAVSQVKVQVAGYVYSVEDKQPIVGASIYAIPAGESAAIAFAITDASGRFRLEFSKENFRVDSLTIGLRSLQYEERNVTISLESTENITFYTTKKESLLPEVLVEGKTPAITQSKDTIIYKASAFSSQEDRVLADILKKMPGLQVLDNGQILYQGEPIQKFYINGLDLLEGRYALASENLPTNAIEAVQVLENHQPIRYLDSLVFNEKSSINIQLKPDITTAGTAEVGAGALPFLWRANITPMLFAKKQQMIASVKTNNIGEDVAKQLNVLSIEDLKAMSDFKVSDENFLRIIPIPKPLFEDQRYLLNNSKLVNVSYLQRLPNELDLKLNANYLHDRFRGESLTQTTFLLPSDTIKINEENNVSDLNNFFRADLHLEKNNQKGYFKNSVNLSHTWNSRQGIINNLPEEHIQQLNLPRQSYSNTLKFLKRVGNSSLNINSNLLYRSGQEKLTIETINSNSSEKSLAFQELHTEDLITDNSISLINTLKKWTADNKIGLRYNRQRLTSIRNYRTDIIGDDFEDIPENSLRLQESELYIKSNWQYNADRLKAEFEIPARLNHQQVQEKQLQSYRQNGRILFTPRVTATYILNSFWKVRAGLSYKEYLSSVSELITSPILKDYRTGYRNTAFWPQVKALSQRVSIQYRNPVNAVFFTANLVNSSDINNAVRQLNLQPDGLNQIVWVPGSARTNQTIFSTETNKLISDIKTSISLGTIISANSTQAILNNADATIQNQLYEVDAKVSTRYSKLFTLQAELTYNLTNTQLSEGSRFSVFEQQYNVQLNVFVLKDHIVKAQSQLYINKANQIINQALFTDLTYSYAWKQFDFSLAFLNLFNTKFYSSTFIDTNIIVQNNYNLRPAQFLVSCSLSF